MRGIGRLRHLCRRAHQRINPGALILAYHRVYAPRRDPQLLCVSPENFRTHLEVLKNIANPISMQQLLESATTARKVRRAVVITFDDGYRDNYEQARRILAEYKVPATFFITTGHINARREFWWDELDRIFLSSGRLPAYLKLRIGEREVEYELGAHGKYFEQDTRRDASWDVTYADRPTERHRIYDSLCNLFREANVVDREDALSALRAWAGDNSSGRSEYYAMTDLEVLKLSQSEIFEVAAHTVNHPRLAAIDIAEQRAEVANSKTQLEAISGAQVSGFAYPFGGRGDYTPDTVSAVRSCGFNWACSNFEGVVRRSTDRFQLPRYLVRNWDRDTFTAFLSTRL